MNGLKSFVCKLKKKATFTNPSVPDNDVFEEIGVRPFFFTPNNLFLDGWTAGWRSHGRKKIRKEGCTWLVDENARGRLETRRRKQAPVFL